MSLQLGQEWDVGGDREVMGWDRELIEGELRVVVQENGTLLERVRVSELEAKHLEEEVARAATKIVELTQELAGAHANGGGGDIGFV